jgi:A/G-specific adenine glycosylase
MSDERERKRSGRREWREGDEPLSHVNRLPITPHSSPVTVFAAALLAWFDHAGRKHLPWQRDPTPYRVWVSEIMLQQTQVATVISYYERFMQRFPDVDALAAAPLDEVLHLWTGLGYYARARNLHRAAQMIVADHGSEMPGTLEAVQQLPGIGRSTAGAILALSRNERHPILDGNVKRVLARYFGVEGFPGDPKIERALWAHADRCTPTERVAAYTQAIMDLGATVCVRTRPLCAACPLHEHCVARIAHRQSVLPTPRPKKHRPHKVAYALIAMRESGAVLLEQRPNAGLWGGLWTFPQFEDRESLAHWLKEHLGIGHPQHEELPAYHHAFTHFDLTLHPCLVRTVAMPNHIAEPGRLWYDAAFPQKIGLTKPAVDLIQAL